MWYDTIQEIKELPEIGRDVWLKYGRRERGELSWKKGRVRGMSLSDMIEIFSHHRAASKNQLSLAAGEGHVITRTCRC